MVAYLILFCISTIFIYFKSIFQNNFVIDFFIIALFLSLIFSIFYSWLKIINSLINQKQLGVPIFIFIFSYFISLIRVSSLFLARIFQNKNGLIFNVDLGHALTHANTVARFGNLENSLTFLGSKVNYHAGPAYFSGLLDKYIGIPVEITTIVLIPILSFTAFLYSFYIISRTQNNAKLSWSLLSVACFLPNIFLRSNLYGILTNLTSIKTEYMMSQPYQANLMQNSMWAGSALFAAFAFSLLKPSKFNLLFSYIVILSTFAIKPAYCISGLFIFLCIIFCLKKYHKFFINLRKNISYSYLIIFAFLSLTWLKMSSYILNESNTEINLMQLRNLFSNKIDDYNIFMTRNILITILIVFMFFIIVEFLGKNYCDHIEELNPKINFKKLIIYLTIIYPIFHIVCILFPVNTYINVGGLTNLDVGFLKENMFKYSNYGSIVDYNLQTLFPIKDFLKVIFLIYLSSYFYEMKNYFHHKRGFILRKINPYILITYIFSILSIYFNIIFLGDIIGNPKSKLAYENANETSLKEILKKLPIEDVIIITNELGYPDNNFIRNYTGTSLTAFTQHKYYLTNLRYERQYKNEDALNKYLNHKRFFNNKLTKESINFLNKNNISHILIRKKSPNQPTSWIKDKKINNYFFKIDENNDWIIYKIK